MITLQDIQNAQTRIAPYVKRTPLVKSRTLSEHLGTNVYIKLELFQNTGSFKPRGAFNKMLQLTPQQREMGVVAVSGGNFAQGVAYAGAVLGIKTLILMPTYTPQNYLDATAGYGAEIETGPDIGELFRKAREYGEQGRVFMHPFDDPISMAGYGTVGPELLEDVPQMSDVFVSVGGGGLMSGIATSVKALKPDVRVWSVETEGADALAQAMKAGKVVNIQPTSLAKTLGAPYTSEFALQVVQTQVQEHLLVSDKEAYFAQRLILERAKVLTELAASCTLAAARRVKAQFTPESQVVLVLCGGNVSFDNLVAYQAQFGSENG
jgi:threonine dehydratase